MECSVHFEKLCQFKPRRLLFVMGSVAIIILLFQSLMLPYRNALLSLSPDNKVIKLGKSIFSSGNSPPKTMNSGNFLLVDALNSTESSVILGVVKSSNDSNTMKETEYNEEAEDQDDDFVSEKDRDPDNAFELDEEIESENEILSEEFVNENSTPEDFKDVHIGSLVDRPTETKHNLSLEQIITPDSGFSFDKGQKADTSMTLENTRSKDAGTTFSLLALSPVASLTNMTCLRGSDAKCNESIILLTFNNNQLPIRKKVRSEMPPRSVTSIAEMNHLLLRSRASPRSLKPRWSSVRDKELLSAKLQIQNAPVVRNDRELYAPLFRNVSMFKRSYELMEHLLKVYVYREGGKPIFHQPILKGIYASEGWFMKLMEGNKQFSVKDPRKAHLFYMPFSTRMLEFTLYVRNSHNRTNLRQYLKSYAEMIAAKYPFWNRTGGTDHFLVGCHDWAPYETRHHMERCIKALCNADVTTGFKIGRDVSLPETYVRSAKNPQRDIGGKPVSERKILAFYAGNIHGYLRPILLKYWENRDPDMKILGPMPSGVASKMNYIQHMKSSKYCICPRGYEVNSPRVVEAIFYECVPVIISDNFVPPFFEVLDWEAFSVILPEKDIPNLKDILLSISHKKYLAMQLNVKKVQRHFLWHTKPLKYDLFYMTLHSIWFNRVFQLKLR